MVNYRTYSHIIRSLSYTKSNLDLYSLGLVKKIQLAVNSALGEVGKLASKLMLGNNACFNTVCRILQLLLAYVFNTRDI